MISNNNTITNLATIFISLLIIFKIITIILLHKEPLEYEIRKNTIYQQVKNIKLKVPFSQTPLNKQEILETLMYNEANLKFITGKPNSESKIINSYSTIASMTNTTS